MLTSVDKFVSASDKIARLDRRWQSLDGLKNETAFIWIDAKTKESLLDPGDQFAVSAYDEWLTERCRHIDAGLKVINDRQDQV